MPLHDSMQIFIVHLLPKDCVESVIGQKDCFWKWLFLKLCRSMKWKIRHKCFLLIQQTVLKLLAVSFEYK